MFCNSCAPHQIYHEQVISSAKTGELVYSGRIEASGYYYSAPIAADNKIYIASEEGVEVVLDGVANLKILGANKPDGAILATPALVEWSIYVRFAPRYGGQNSDEDTLRQIELECCARQRESIMNRDFLRAAASLHEIEPLAGR